MKEEETRRKDKQEKEEKRRKAEDDDRFQKLIEDMIHMWATVRNRGHLVASSAAGVKWKPLECSLAPWGSGRVAPGEVEPCTCDAGLCGTGWVCVASEEHPRCFNCPKAVRIDGHQKGALRLAYLSVKVLIASRCRLPFVPESVTATRSDQRCDALTQKLLAFSRSANYVLLRNTDQQSYPPDNRFAKILASFTALLLMKREGKENM